MTRTIAAAAIAITAAAMLSGCGTPRLRTEPVVSTVCMDLGKMPEEEVAYTRRKAAQYLSDKGFKLAAPGAACDATAKFDTLGQFQAEMLRGLFLRSSGYWSLEGILTLSRPEKVDLQDQSINLRKYSSKQELLDALAWSVVGPATWTYQTPADLAASAAAVAAAAAASR